MNGYPKIKFCGLVAGQDVLEAATLGVDAIGLVFYPKSPRFVTQEQALALRQLVPPQVLVVGLFVNTPRAQIESMQSNLRLDVLQFHGDESADDLSGWSVPVWRAVRMTSAQDLATSRSMFPMAQQFVLDAHVESYGGAGQTFDWELGREETGAGARSGARSGASGAAKGDCSLRSDLVLSGGLTAQNVAQGIRLLQPAWVDVSSGIQTLDPRRKDPLKMRAFVDAVQNWREQSQGLAE